MDQDTIKAHGHRDVVILPFWLHLNLREDDWIWVWLVLFVFLGCYNASGWCRWCFLLMFLISTRNTWTLSKFRRYCNSSLRTWWFLKYLLTRTSMKDSCRYIWDKVHHHIITNQTYWKSNGVKVSNIRSRRKNLRSILIAIYRFLFTPIGH